MIRMVCSYIPLAIIQPDELFSEERVYVGLSINSIANAHGLKTKSRKKDAVRFILIVNSLPF